jgi:hypothetical protein
VGEDMFVTATRSTGKRSSTVFGGEARVSVHG